MAFSHILDHASQALSRVLTQFRSSAQFKGVLNSLSAEIQELEDAIWGTLAYRQIDTATGATLDTIGRIVGAVPRGGFSDADYRLRVRVQIMVNKSGGTSSDLVDIAKAFHPAWGNTVKTREGGPTSAGYASGSPVGELPHIGSVEIVTVPDGADSGIVSSEARELARYLKAGAAAGVRPVLIYRSSEIAEDGAFRFSGGSPPETPAGFGVGKLFNSLEK